MSISEVCEKYSIKSTDLEQIRYELKQLLKEAHPDNNNGEYNLDDFEELKEALEFIDKEKRTQNEVEKNEVLVLTRALADVLQNSQVVRLHESKALEEKLELAIENQSVLIREKTRVKRISLASITAVVTFLWLLPEKIMSHPILSALISYNEEEDYRFFSAVFLFVWFLLLLFTIIYWKSVFDIEQKEKYLLERIKSKSVQNQILMRFLKEIQMDDKNTFSREDFVWYVSEDLKREIERGTFHRRDRCLYRRSICMRNGISEAIIHNIVDIILMNAEERGVIGRVEKRSIIDYYRIIEE